MYFGLPLHSEQLSRITTNTNVPKLHIVIIYYGSANTLDVTRAFMLGKPVWNMKVVETVTVSEYLLQHYMI